MKRNGHPLVVRLPRRCGGFTLLEILIVVVILAILAAQLTHAVYSRGQVSPALRMPIWYYYIAAAIGFFLTGVHFFRALVKNIREEGVHLGVE